MWNEWTIFYCTTVFLLIIYHCYLVHMVHILNFARILMDFFFIHSPCGGNLVKGSHCANLTTSMMPTSSFSMSQMVPRHCLTSISSMKKLPRFSGCIQMDLSLRTSQQTYSWQPLPLHGPVWPCMRCWICWMRGCCTMTQVKFISYPDFFLRLRSFDNTFE